MSVTPEPTDEECKRWALEDLEKNNIGNALGGTLPTLFGTPAQMKNKLDLIEKTLEKKGEQK